MTNDTTPAPIGADVLRERLLAAAPKAAPGEPTPELQHIESAALLALGMLWMTERHSPNAQAAFQTLRNALGGQNALRRGIEAAMNAGYEADHPPGADWWAGKKEHPHE